MWAVVVFGLMGIGIIPLYFFVPDLSKFNGNLPPAELALVGIGVELGAISPSLRRFWLRASCPARAGHEPCSGS